MDHDTRTTTALRRAAKDPRFLDPAWSSNRYLRAVHRSYLAGTKAAIAAAEALPLAPTDRQMLAFMVRLAAGTLAPSNLLLTNPTALRRAVRTRGGSLVRSATCLVDDVLHNGGLPSLVDRQAFTVGRNLATTPGRVVFRNHLMELIQYEPRTPTVHAVPLVVCPPWVNKFYLADLSPGQSIVEWALDHGHTCFMISYRNPDASLRNIGFDDYLRSSLLTSLSVIRDISDAEEVNLLGACLGGLLGLMLAAWLDDDHRPRLRSVTVMNSLTDFTDITPLTASGGIARLLRGPGIRLVELLTSARGVVRGREMEAFFRLLRADDLIWSQVRSRWLMGETAPAYDVMYWNCDTLNVPHRAQRYLLRDLCLGNAFALGTAELAGRRLLPDRISQDVFLVAARDDHLIPWQAAYRTVGLLSGDVRFHLASGGHVDAIVAPPGAGARHWANGHHLPDDPSAWLAGATEYHDTWWRPWARWLAERAGPQRTPPPLGNARHPAMDPAPGPYVLT